MHLIRAISEPQCSDARPHVGQGRVLTHASTSEGLDGAVDDGEGHLWDEDLGFGDLLEGLLGAELVHLDGGVEDDETGGVDFDAGAGDPFEDDAVFAEELAEGLLGFVVDAHEHPVQSSLGLDIVRLIHYVMAEADLQHQCCAWRGGFGQVQDDPG